MDDPSTTTVTEGFGLMFYNARMYDPALGRFTSADSVIPGGAQGLDRYAYVNNSPVNFTDPSGHCYTSSGVWLSGGGDAGCPGASASSGNQGNNNTTNNDTVVSTTPDYCSTYAGACNSSGLNTFSNVPETPAPTDCLAGEKCDKAEALAGVFLIATVDVMEAVFLIVGVLAVGPLAIVPILELTSPLWIPANLAGAYLIFDSGVVKDFNRTAWGINK